MVGSMWTRPLGGGVAENPRDDVAPCAPTNAYDRSAPTTEAAELPFIPCDYIHSDGLVPPAVWMLVGEAGDFYVCDEHFQMRTEEGRRGWHRVTDG